ncbi:retinoblastoma-like protein 1 isoform X1 [Pungitius pungitius]|uniref:retinoblastoma-like protein 1 isoform X1 n=1 Tax=Pungitius pungitius TaxID=134920 RepID=UPI0018879E69|nr:retinoblastoma-like protein 1 isoform X1 [Pungitius pungitius]
MRGEESSDSECGRMEESSVRRSLETLCQELNMDESTASETMDSFSGIWNTYTLEGEVVHWLACSLYAACRKGSTPTVGKGLMEGNCVSLTRILRTAKLSLIQFFSKMRKWADMSNLPQDFRLRMERLERNFEVSTVIFRKFEPIFMDMFQDPQGGGRPRQPRSRKHRRLPCHISDVFKFCWTLFVYTKGNFRMIGDDLVNSYHLLLCCLDLVFGNALLCNNRKELINPTFRGLPALHPAGGLQSDEPPPCVLERLCELHDGLVVEAKGIKQHYFKPYIQKLYHREILKGNEDHLTELLDPQNFIDNNKAINREYEEYVLTVGDFDERVFLGADADEEIGTPRKVLQEPSQTNSQSPPHQHVEKSGSLAPPTPLTGRGYLKEKDLLVTPVSSATQSVSRLQSMVSGLRASPSEQLLQMFRSCSRNPTESILGRVKTLGQTFKHHYTKDSEDMPGSHIDFAENRLKLAEILYYKILENVLLQETKRLHGKDMSVLLEQDMFHCSLVACCLEVVLFSYSSQRTFPWIIDIFKLTPFYFFKVIEVFIRSEEGLSRDMVKHLNLIEEQVLESRAWRADSALWSALEAAGSKVPTVEEVNFPSSLDTGSGPGGGVPSHLPLVALSPIIHPRIREFRSGLGSARKDVPPSPLSVHDRYSSPAAGSAKRRLFGDDPPSRPPCVTPGSHVTSPAKRLTFGCGGTLRIGAQSAQTTVLSIPLQGGNNERTITLIPVQPCDSSGTITAQFLLTASPSRAPGPVTSDPQVGNARPRRTGSLALFFRKVYHLASVRLRDLCVRMDVSSELRGKIWTCFENSLVHSTGLMRDRHLDQLLLCCVYIVSKITKETHSFHDIMKCYRCQPQASSHVYRSVLLRHKEQATDENMEVDPVSGGESAEKIDEGAGPARAADQSEERGDLIQFYNSVFVLKMKSFALRYATQDHRADAPPLSPFPSVRAQPLSPRRVSQRHSLYVSPHKSSACCLTPNSFTYRINSSPAKELSDINRMIRQGSSSRKRAFTMEGDVMMSSACDSPSKKACPESGSSADVLLKRLQDVVSERQSH